MKYSRLIIGFLVASIALWAVAGEQMSGVSANAFVNARVVTLRSETAGRLNLPSRTLGSFVSKGETLGSVIDPLVDKVCLNDLQLDLEKKASEIIWIERRIRGLKQVLEKLERRAIAYQNRRVAELRLQVVRARNRLEVLEEHRGLRAADNQVADTVTWTVERMPGEQVTFELELEHARERVEVLENSLRAAVTGIFLGDGYNDAPNSEQRSNALALELEELVLSLRLHKDEQIAIKERLLKEMLRVRRLEEAEIAAPVSGIYWEVIEADSVSIQSGDPIVRIVDCSSVIISLSVSEMTFNSLSLGAQAKFRFMNDSHVYDGTIIRLAGSGADKVYNNLAVAPGQRHLERYDVTVHVPEIAESPDLACGIGRTGRVFFDRRPLDFLREVFR